MSGKTGGGRQKRGDLFERLYRDTTISHGAYRIWHGLYHSANKVTGLCFPGFRTLQKDLSCSNDSVGRWVRELQEAGWLQVSRKPRSNSKLGFRNEYILLDGQGNAIFGGYSVPDPRVPDFRGSLNHDEGAHDPVSGSLIISGTEPSSPPQGGVNKEENQEGGAPSVAAPASLAAGGAAPSAPPEEANGKAKGTRGRKAMRKRREALRNPSIPSQPAEQSEQVGEVGQEKRIATVSADGGTALDQGRVWGDEQ